MDVMNFNNQAGSVVLKKIVRVGPVHETTRDHHQFIIYLEGNHTATVVDDSYENVTALRAELIRSLWRLPE